MFTKEERIANKTLGNPDKGSCAYPGELGSAIPRFSARLAKINANKSPLVDSTPLNKKAKKKMQSDSPPSSEGSAIAKTLFKRDTKHRMCASNAPSHKQKAMRK